MINLLSISAPAKPAARPNSISVNACRIIMVKIRTLVAPRAIRIPISRVRCVTANAITPVSPAAVMTSARTANTPSSQVVWRGDATESSSTSLKSFHLIDRGLRVYLMDHVTHQPRLLQRRSFRFDHQE